MTSLVALVAIAGGQIYPFLDPVGGCLVSLLIIRVGYQSGKAACQEIVDRGVDQEITDMVKEAALKALDQKDEGVKVTNVRGTKSGTYYIVDVEVECDGNTTIDEFEGIKNKVIDGVKKNAKNVKIVRVFVKPAEEGKKGNEEKEIVDKDGI